MIQVFLKISKLLKILFTFVLEPKHIICPYFLYLITISFSKM